MRVNDVLQLDIVSSGMDGEGVARVDGYVIFVPYALVGERVTARIVHLKKNFGYAEIVNVILPSKGRIKPICRVYPKCGGCDLQHADRSVEDAIKRDKVYSCLKKAGFDLEVDEVVSGERRYGYRNKLQLPFGTKDRRTVLGFYMKDSHNVVPTTTCPLHGEWADKLIARVTDWANKYAIPVYDERKERGVLRHLVARFVLDTLNVVIVANAEKLPRTEELYRAIEDISSTVNLWYSPLTRRTNVIMGDKIVEVRVHDEPIEIYGVRARINPYTFLQVNDEVRDMLYERVIREVGVDNDVVIDAYSGMGLMTAQLSKGAKTVYGIEIVEEAVRDADEVMRLNDIQNVTNICGDTSKVLPDLVKSLTGRKITVVLDPPRKGCDEATLNSVVSANPDRIIYVSCNPATLARDLTMLEGYDITSVTPYNMFPMTGHVECVVLLSKVQN